MTDEERPASAVRPDHRPQIDASAPNVARVRDYLTGGRDNFDADRKAARQLIKAAPSMEYSGYASRDFITRVTRYLAGEAGLRQFLDIGTGIPAGSGIHDTAQQIAPSSRVVCVDSDPVVLSHARALLRPAPEGATAFIDADVREPGKIVAEAAATLDFGQPVAIFMNHLLNFVPRDADVRSILDTMMDAACPGSHLVVLHPASDLDPDLAEAARRWNKISTVQVVLRGEAELAAWFTGLDLVDPGIVPVADWRPGPPEPAPSSVFASESWTPSRDSAQTEPPDGMVIPLYGAVARKPLHAVYAERRAGRLRVLPDHRGRGAVLDSPRDRLRRRLPRPEPGYPGPHPRRPPPPRV